MAKPFYILPLFLLCVSAASGQEALRPPTLKGTEKSTEGVLTCRPQKPLSHTWICIDSNGKERNNLIIKDRDAK